MRRPLSHLSFVIQDLINNISCKDWIAYAKTREELQEYVDKCDRIYNIGRGGCPKIKKIISPPPPIRKFDREEDWWMLP